MASGNQQQTQMRAASFFAGAAMPWACSSSSSTSSSSGLQQQQQQQRARLAPATMTFGLPALLQQGGGARRRGGAPPPPFASVGAAAASATGGVPKLFATKKTEEHTGIAFPDTLCVVGKHDCPGLAGVGVRAKRILGLKNINVYALGLYVDAHGAKKALAKFKGRDADALAAEQPAYDALVNADAFERSLRLVISFGSLKRATFVSALEERLAPPLRKAGKAAVLKQFEALFDGATFGRGTEIDFSASGKGRLVTRIDGKQVGTIESPELVRALFDIYLGPDPVSADAKADFARGLAALLRE